MEGIEDDFDLDSSEDSTGSPAWSNWESYPSHVLTATERILPKIDPDEMNKSFMNLQSYQQMLQIEIRYTPEQVEALDFPSLEAQLLRKSCDMADVLNEVFRTSGRTFTSIIVEFAQNLFDGYWFTTERSFFYEITPGDVVGYFSDPPSIQFFVGRVRNNEILVRQFRPGKSKLPLIIAGRMSNTKSEIDAHFRTNYQIDTQVNTLSFVRNPPVYQRALYFAGMGDLQGLKSLVEHHNFDIGTKKPEAQNYTVMRLAKLKNHVNVVKWLLSLKQLKGNEEDESENEEADSEGMYLYV